MTKTLGFMLSACLAATACARHAEVRDTGTVTTPELVAIESDPSVMVVANADEPVFYSENTYWLYRDHGWYRSRSHRGGWARIEHPPEHVRRIERPTAYVHYRREAHPPRTTYNRVEPSRDARIQMNEPSPQRPQQPYANPLPPQQVPPAPSDVLFTDPARAPTSPGMRNRASDQRPAMNRDDRPGLGPDRALPPPKKN